MKRQVISLTDLEILKTKLSLTNYPVAYLVFPELQRPATPFISYYVTYENAKQADNKNTESSKQVTVELYTSRKNPTAEAAVETALADYPFKKSESYVWEEDCLCISYDLELV